MITPLKKGAFSAEEDQIIRENYLLIPATAIDKLLGRGRSSSLQRMRKLKLRVPPDLLDQFKKIGQRKKGEPGPGKGKGKYARPIREPGYKKKVFKRFTQEEDDYIKKNYLTLTAVEIGKSLNRSDTSCSGRMKLLGLHIPPEIMEGFKRRGFMAPGYVPYNKGKDMTEEVKRKISEANKGRVPHNKGKAWIEWQTQESFNRFRFASVGKIAHNALDEDEISEHEQGGRKYKFIKKQGKWIRLHREIWVNNNGPVPEGYVVSFKDGNTLNCELENLVLITHSELARKNNYHLNYPGPLAHCILLRGLLIKSIKNQLKKEKDEKEKFNL